MIFNDIWLYVWYSGEEFSSDFLVFTKFIYYQVAFLYYTIWTVIFQRGSMDSE